MDSLASLWQILCFSVSAVALFDSVLSRETPKFECENSKAGRHYIVDSTGYVCPRDGMDYTTGCCSSGALHSCNTCHLNDKCCSSYEHCVSCCLRPDFNATGLVRLQYRIHEHSNTGTWDNEFQYCMGKCRTHQRSTQHENSFIDARHFCFSDSSRPKTAEGPEPIPANVVIAAGEKGADCEAVCEARSMACSAAYIPTISQCDVLREAFDCEAGCYAASGEMAVEAPAYVVYGTPKPQFPTLCFTLPEGHAPSCTSSQPHLQRLCACVEARPGEVVSESAATLQEGDDTSKQDQGVGEVM